MFTNKYCIKYNVQKLINYLEKNFRLDFIVMIKDDVSTNYKFTIELKRALKLILI
jgi:hypothetical protein